MIGLRNYLLACALCMCWTAAAPTLSAQPARAAKPDEGKSPQPSGPSPTRTPSPDEELAPIAAVLAERCLACHGDDKQEGNYSVADFAKLRASGDSAKEPVVPGQPEASELYRRLITSDESERMPAESQPLEADELAMIKAWIAGGARIPTNLEQRPLAQWPRSEPPRVIPEHYPAALPIAAVALTPDARSVWTSGYGEVIQWEPSTGRLLQRRRVAGTQIADIELSRDGRYLAVSSGSPGTLGVVQVWQLDAPPSAAALWSDTSSDVAADIAFAPPEARLAIGRADGSLQIVDLREISGQSPPAGSSFTPHADAVLCVAWSDTGDRLITGSRDRTAKIFDAKTMGLIANYDRHQRAVGGVAYSGTHPVSFDETGQLRLWSGDDSDRTIAEQSNLPRFLEHIVSAGEQIYLADGAEVRIFSVNKKQTEDGKDDSGKPKLKTTTRWSEEKRLESGGRSWIMSLSYLQDSLAAGTESGEIVVWEKNVSMPKFKFTAQP